MSEILDRRSSTNASKIVTAKPIEFNPPPKPENPEPVGAVVLGLMSDGTVAILDVQPPSLNLANITSACLRIANGTFHELLGRATMGQYVSRETVEEETEVPEEEIKDSGLLPPILRVENYE